MDDLKALTSPPSPFAGLSVMVHLDHIQWDADAELLGWDMSQFSSIMYDASVLPFDENIRRTAEFVKHHGKEIFIEGACDEIAEASEHKPSQLTSPRWPIAISARPAWT